MVWNESEYHGWIFVNCPIGSSRRDLSLCSLRRPTFPFKQIGVSQDHSLSKQQICTEKIINDFSLEIIAAPLGSATVGLSACAGIQSPSNRSVLKLANVWFQSRLPYCHRLSLKRNKGAVHSFVGFFVLAKSHQEHTSCRSMHTFQASFPPRKVPATSSTTHCIEPRPRRVWCLKLSNHEWYIWTHGSTQNSD